MRGVFTQYGIEASWAINGGTIHIKFKDGNDFNEFFRQLLSQR